jgi:predicted secreted protein
MRSLSRFFIIVALKLLKALVPVVAVALAVGSGAASARDGGAPGAPPTSPKLSTLPPTVAAGGAAVVPPPPAVRSADAILADSIKATGGDGPWKSHHSIETRTQIEYAKMAISGTRTQTLTAHNKSLAVTVIPNVGEVREGTNGRVVWSEDPVNGLRVLDGAEAAQFRQESTWNLERNLKKVFVKIAVKADTDGGRALECLELTPTAGHPYTFCYDAETHLQILQKGTAATPQGDVPFTSRVKTWRDAGGMKLPDVVEMTTGPIEVSARLIDVAFDKPVDEKIFEIPGAAGKGKGAAKSKAKPAAPAQ